MNKKTKTLTHADFGRRVGVSKQAVSKAAKEGSLKEAAVGDRIDANHPAAIKYAKRPRKRPKPDPKPDSVATVAKDTDGEPTNGAGSHGDTMITDSGLDISRYADFTLRELVDRFGSVRALKDWLEALKKIEDIREKRLNNEEVQQNLISRELVKTHVFGFLDAGNRRLLGDASKTIARRLYGLARSGAPVEEAEALVREIIGSQLEPQKQRVAKLLREAG